MAALAVKAPVAKIGVFDSPRPSDLPPTAEALLRELGGPAWIRVPGRDRSRTRAVATLLHGNEPSGLRAVHAWLRSGAQPAVDVVLFIASPAAALEPPGFAFRTLPGELDLNRCFLPPFEGDEGALAREVLRLLGEAAPEALIDLHNNTGHSPAYGVGPRVGPVQLGLTSLFGDRYIHNTLHLGALVEATQAEFPGVVVECGFAGSLRADDVARVGLERYLSCEQVMPPPRGVRSPTVLTNPIRVRLRASLRLAYADGPVDGVDLTIDREVDRHNFETLRPDVPIGWVASSELWPLEARGASGADVSSELFTVRDGVLRMRRPVVPIMMTTDPGIAVSDCLFYLVDPPPA